MSSSRRAGTPSRSCLHGRPGPPRGTASAYVRVDRSDELSGSARARRRRRKQRHRHRRRPPACRRSRDRVDAYGAEYLPRDWLRAPLGPSALLGEHLPAAPVDAIGRFIQWQVYGDLSPYGIPRAPEGYATRFRRTGVNPAVDDGFVTGAQGRPGRSRRRGRTPRYPKPRSWLQASASMSMPSSLRTGYRRGLEGLVGHLNVLDDRGAPRHWRGAPGDPTTPGLYFAGFEVRLSGSIRASGIHARRIAKTVADDNRVPA